LRDLEGRRCCPPFFCAGVAVWWLRSASALADRQDDQRHVGWFQSLNSP
jgi:hypothetical protein